jgi:hypothetical protein
MIDDFPITVDPIDTKRVDEIKEAWREVRKSSITERIKIWET